MEFQSLSPAFQSVILSMIANGLTAVLGGLGQKLIAGLIGDQSKPADLNSLLKEGITDVAEAIDWKGPGRMEEICLFLCSSEAEEAVRRIFATQLIGGSEADDLDEIKKYFTRSFETYAGVGGDATKQAAKTLFNALVSGCELALKHSIEQGILTAHEAMSNVRFRLLRDSLASIHRVLEHLNKSESLDLSALQKFEARYRRQVTNRHKHLIPPHLDSAKKIPIDSIYVCPSFRASQNRKQADRLLNTNELLLETYRVVVLGNPGGGKSTLATKFLHDLSLHYEQRLLAGRKVTPILVVLREYGAEKKQHQISILDYIERTSNSTYQIKPPQDAFEHMLLNGRAFVIFDGLDELIDTAYRQQISGDIESFCELYPTVPVLVTSREVGYEQAPLDDEQFSVFRLAPFDRHQTQEYVEKWFGTDKELKPAERKQKASSFLKESKIVPDLISNPLMLGLMCSIYRGDNYIPKNRPDVYEKCALMLFERWDKSRDIIVKLPFELHLRSTMMYLANWIHSDEALQGGVTEDKLISKAAEYLLTRRFEDIAEAESASKEFIGFCSGRAWVFTDTGTTGDGERLYQFTHRTFLEYFAACYLVRNHPTAASLAGVLLPKIECQEWDVVAQLSFQILNKNVENGGDELLNLVLERSKENDPDKKVNLISFAARALEFLVPSPKLCKLIATSTLQVFLDLSGKIIQVGEKPERRDLPLLKPLFRCTEENLGHIISALESSLRKEILEAKSEEQAVGAFEILANSWVFFGVIRLPGEEVDTVHLERLALWEGMSKRVLDETVTTRMALAEKHLGLAIDACREKMVTVKWLAEKFGVQKLFNNNLYSLLPRSYRLSLFNVVLNYTLTDRQGRKSIEEIGDLVLSAPQPFISHSEIDSILFLNNSLLYCHDNGSVLSPNCIFGLFCFSAVFSETTGIGGSNLELDKISHPLLSKLLKARYSPLPSDWEEELKRSEFTQVQKEFISNWVTGKLHLVSRDDGSEKNAGE